MPQDAERSVIIIDGVYLLKKKLGEGGMATVFLAAVDQARFDYSTLFAYTQVQAGTHTERLRKAKELAAGMKGRNLDLATIRTILELQKIPLPGKVAAVKVAKPGQGRERFESEWTNLLCLNHEHVVKVYGGGVYSHRPYYALELLEDIVPSKRVVGEFSLLDKIRVAIQAGHGLAYLHANGLVHRDMKPDNAVTVRQADGAYRTVVTDLGLAKNLEEDLGMTNTASVMGTPYFMSPEQMRSARDVDFRTDIYSLGGMLYELVTRKKPFHDKSSVFEILRTAALGERPIPPERHVGNLPEHIASIIKTAMGYELAERYQTMQEFLADLESFCEVERQGLSTSRHFEDFKAAGPVRKEDGWHYRKYLGRTRAPRLSVRSARLQVKKPEVPEGASAAPATAPDRRRLLVAAGAVAALALVVAVIVALRGGGRETGPAPPPALAITQATAPAAPEKPSEPLPPPRSAPAGQEEPDPPDQAQKKWGPMMRWPFEPQEARHRQEKAARFANLPVEASLELGGGVKLDLVLVPFGMFLMGSPQGEPQRGNNENQHKVRLSRSFYIGRHEVTLAQWRAVMGGDSPSGFKGRPDSDRRPVEQVSWNDVNERFLPRLNRMLRSRPAAHPWLFRLPTEAEWEYACRAGSGSPFSCGDTLSPEQANVNAEPLDGQGRAGAARKETAPVGSFPPNAWGIFDMHGNVWEWCADLYDGSYYAVAPFVDPPGPASGQGRVIRGGCWNQGATAARSANRFRMDQGSRSNNLGFRVLCAVGPTFPAAP